MSACTQAVASFVLGLVAATAVTQHAIATQTDLKSKKSPTVYDPDQMPWVTRPGGSRRRDTQSIDPVFVLDNCVPTKEEPTIHVDYIYDDEISGGRSGWFCVKGAYGGLRDPVRQDGDDCLVSAVWPEKWKEDGYDCETQTISHGVSCEASERGEDLGDVGGVRECRAAAASAGCSMFMFPRYQSWGCRCCSALDNPVRDPDWAVYDLREPARKVTKKYQANDIHAGCEVAAVNEKNENTLTCLDDFPANGLGPASLAVQATRAATRHRSDLYNGGGYFKYSFDGDYFVWSADGGDAVEYAYDRDAYDDAYKLYKRGVENATVFYKVSMDCQYQSHPSPGFNTCSLNFVCKEIVETEFISADGLPAEPGTEIYSGDC